MFSIDTIENSTLRFNIQLPQNIHMMILYSHLINGATMSISINEVLYRLTNEYHQNIEDRLCYIIVLIDNSNDTTCNHKSIIYLRIKIDSPIVLIMKRLLSIDGSRKKYSIVIQFNAPSALDSFTRRPFDDFRLITTHLIPLKC